MTTATTYTYGDHVPNQPATPSRSMRAADPEWEGLDVATKSQGIDRTKWLKQAMDWHFYKPGVEPPPRLPLPELLALITEAAESAPSVTSDQRRRKLALQEMAEQLSRRVAQHSEEGKS